MIFCSYASHLPVFAVAAGPVVGQKQRFAIQDLDHSLFFFLLNMHGKVDSR